MLASDVWIEKLATLSHEDAYNSVDPLSSEDVAVVVFHWFTDCHPEAIFYMNSSRLRRLSLSRYGSLENPGIILALSQSVICLSGNKVTTLVYNIQHVGVPTICTSSTRPL